MSLQSTYLSVKGIIADNLESMGVDASSSDGLTTLAGKILDIEPSIGGLDLDTAVTLSVSSSTVTVGGSITCTATLTAEYDDETLVDVDLHGVLQNATIKLYEGSTLMTSSTTNANGVATLTYTPTSSGTKTIKVVFDGTDNFNDCESATQTITVTQPEVGDVEITSTKSILSYADSDTATITATVFDDSSTPVPISGASVTIKVDGTTVKTADTDSNGEVSYTYTSTGAGDVTISAECMSVTETYTIRDAIYYNDGTITTATELTGLSIPTNFVATFKVKRASGSSNQSWLEVGSNNQNCIFGGQDGRDGSIGVYVRVNNTYERYEHSSDGVLSIGVETPVEFKYDNGAISVKANNTTKSVNSSTITARSYVNCNIVNNQMKELLIMPL